MTSSPLSSPEIVDQTIPNNQLSISSISINNAGGTLGDTKVLAPFPTSSQNNGGLSDKNGHAGGMENKKVQGDRYAALKDLDDIFKSTVMSDGKFF